MQKNRRFADTSVREKAMSWLVDLVDSDTTTPPAESVPYKIAEHYDLVYCERLAGLGVGCRLLPVNYATLVRKHIPQC